MCIRDSYKSIVRLQGGLRKPGYKDPVKTFRHLDSKERYVRLKYLEEAFLVVPFPATRPEKLVYSFLRRLGINFRFQWTHPDYETTAYVESFKPDFTLPDHKIVIEVNGAYWHLKPETRERDLIKYSLLNLQGWKVVVWWDWEIEENLVGLFRRDLPELYPVSDYIKETIPREDDWEEARKEARVRQAFSERFSRSYKPLRSLPKGDYSLEIRERPIYGQFRELPFGKKAKLDFKPFSVFKGYYSPSTSKLKGYG